MENNLQNRVNLGKMKLVAILPEVRIEKRYMKLEKKYNELILKIDKIKPKRVKIDEVQTKSKDKGQGTSCPLKKTLTMSFRGEMSERICSRER